MDTMDRRALLKMLSAMPMAALVITEAEARQAHHQVQTAKQAAQKTGTAFKPKFFTAHEYETVRTLSPPRRKAVIQAAAQPRERLEHVQECHQST